MWTVAPGRPPRTRYAERKANGTARAGHAASAQAPAARSAAGLAGRRHRGWPDPGPCRWRALPGQPLGTIRYRGRRPTWLAGAGGAGWSRAVGQEEPAASKGQDQADRDAGDQPAPPRTGRLEPGRRRGVRLAQCHSLSSLHARSGGGRPGGDRPHRQSILSRCCGGKANVNSSHAVHPRSTQSPERPIRTSLRSLVDCPASCGQAPAPPPNPPR